MTVSELALIGIVAVAVVVAVLSVWVSNRVSYRELITVQAPADRVFNAVLHQEQLMAWSAWPAATNSTCRLVGVDGQVGATLEFITQGKVSGSQSVTEVVPGQRVTVALTDPSPFGQRPVVSFVVDPLGPTTTQVTLEFVNTIRRPFQLVLKSLGIVRWVRDLHRKDLAGLKAFCESRPGAQPSQGLAPGQA